MHCKKKCIILKIDYLTFATTVPLIATACADKLCRTLVTALTAGRAISVFSGISNSHGEPWIPFFEHIFVCIILQKTFETLDIVKLIWITLPLKINQLTMWIKLLWFCTGVLITGVIVISVRAWNRNGKFVRHRKWRQSIKNIRKKRDESDATLEEERKSLMDTGLAPW